MLLGVVQTSLGVRAMLVDALQQVGIGSLYGSISSRYAITE